MPETQARRKPQTYAAIDYAQMNSTPGQAVPKPIPFDVGRFFTRPYDRQSESKELNDWMLHLWRDRLDTCRAIIERKLASFHDDRKIAQEKRRRYLLWIIFHETTHPDGNEEVARMAFDGLFPRKGK